jgi:hypothetical protein
MSTPLEEPLVRYGIGLSGAIVIAVVGVLYLDGIARYAAFTIAALDAVLTPKLLEKAVKSNADAVSR